MATRRWLGRAIAVAQVDTITVANTWAQNDTVTLTINNKSIVITIGTLVTTAQVATTIKQVINGESLTDTAATYTAYGTAVGEFSRLTATVNSSVVSITANDAGVPFTLSVTESTAGDGTATEATATAATGPNHWDNVDNWSGNAVPVDDDDIVFDAGDVDLLYALSTGIQPDSITVTPGYTGEIGLPEVNTDNTELPYDEYRAKYLTFATNAGATAVSIEAGSGRIRIDMGDCTSVTHNIRGSGTRAEEQVPAILLLGSDADTVLNVQRGDVGVAFYAGETAHLASINVGWLERQDSDSAVVCGSGVDLANAAISMTGGSLQTNSATGSGTIALNGGEIELLSGAHASIIADAGTVYYRSTGTLSAGKAGSGGVFNFTRDNRGRTVSAMELYEGGSILDPNKTVTWSTGVDLVRCGIPADGSLNLGTHLTLTPSAI